MALVVFLPLFLTALAGAFIFMLYVYQITAADSVCKKEVMRTQHELSGITKNLVKLNRIATNLRTQREYADAQLAAARASGYVPAIAAAEAYQKSVLLAQTILAAQQKALLASAAGERLSSEQRIHADGSRHGLRDVHGTFDHAITLGLQAKPPTSLTPDYVEESFYRDRQSQTYHYKLHLFDRLPDWLKQHVRNRPVLADLMRPVARSCSATLSGEEDNWKPILRKDKLSWSL